MLHVVLEGEYRWPVCCLRWNEECGASCCTLLPVIKYFSDLEKLSKKLSWLWKKKHKDFKEVASFVKEDMFGIGRLQ